jgi:hypothetical protein
MPTNGVGTFVSKDTFFWMYMLLDLVAVVGVLKRPQTLSR